jgi:hypothetical protein
VWQIVFRILLSEVQDLIATSHSWGHAAPSGDSGASTLQAASQHHAKKRCQAPAHGRPSISMPHKLTSSPTHLKALQERLLVPRRIDL